jgi:hypothetical protein
MRAALAAFLVSIASGWLAGCAGMYPVAVTTRLPAGLNVTPYSRLLVAGFVGGGIDDVDTNAETVRLLRSQLRAARSLTIISADAMPITRATLADPAFWRRVGEEYQNPLVLTGIVVLTSERHTDLMYREREFFDDEGRRRIEMNRTAVEIETRTLTARLLYIDGQTGAIIHARVFREDTSHAASQTVPALSSYFELMARLVPEVLGTVSDHTVVGSRTLLR